MRRVEVVLDRVGVSRRRRQACLGARGESSIPTYQLAARAHLAEERRLGGGDRDLGGES